AVHFRHPRPRPRAPPPGARPHRVRHSPRADVRRPRRPARRRPARRPGHRSRGARPRRPDRRHRPVRALPRLGFPRPAAQPGKELTMTATSAQPGAAQAVGPSRSGRGERLLWARPGDPLGARPALLGLLVRTGLLSLAGLSRNGWGNEFYAAAVQAGTKSWKGFLFGSPDFSKFITLGNAG